MRPLIIDLETSIGTGIHGSDFRDPANDYYTLIYGTKPDNIQVCHNKDGWKRGLNDELKQLLLECDVIVGHNLTFDLSYMFKNQELIDFFIRGGRVWDTQVAEYILTAQQHQYASLSELQNKYLGQYEKITRISKLFKAGYGADKIIQAKNRCPKLFSLFNKYCLSDGESTLKIFKSQYIRAKQEGMLDIVSLYQDYLITLITATCSGIPIDVQACEKTLTEFNLKHLEYLAEAEKLVCKVWNNERLPAFNINSNDHKSAVLFGGEIKNMIRTNVGKYKHGGDKFKMVEHKIWVDGWKLPKTLTKESKKSGVYVTDNAVMASIALNTTNVNVKKYCELQKEAMMYKKAANTYVKAFIDRNGNGLLHANFNNVATATGRLSSSAPNLQNVSKRNKFGKTLHNLFIAPTGWKCIQIDFSQLEIFVMAWLSGDETLKHHLLTGVDMHCVRLGYYIDKSYDELVKLCKIDKVDEWVKQRSAAKTVSYQMAYGAMPPKVAESTGLPLEIVEKIYEQEAVTYPRTVQLGNIVMESVKQSATFSLAKNIPNVHKKGINGSKFKNGLELLPIFDIGGNIGYNMEYIRKVGYWKSPTGKKYHFLQNGKMYKGMIKSGFSFTQPKNYPMQGCAADIQGATTAALLNILLKHSDKIKLINEVHDSKWLIIKEEYIDKILTKIVDIIEDVPKIFKERFNIDVPFKFPVDVEIGDNFGDMNPYQK